MKKLLLILAQTLLLSACSSEPLEIEVEEIQNEKEQVFFQRIGDVYDEASFLSPVGDSIVFAAQKDGEAFVVKDGVKVSESYDEIVSIETYGDQYAYVSKKDDSWHVVYGDEKFGPYTAWPPELLPCLNQDGRLVYYDYEYEKGVSDKRSGNPSHIVLGGVQSRVYTYEDPINSSCPTEVYGNYHGDYTVDKSQKIDSMFDVYKNGEYFSGPYEAVDEILDIDGKAAILARGFGFRIEFDNKEVAAPKAVNGLSSWDSSFCGVSEMQNINGKLAFIASFYESCGNEVVYISP